MSQSDPQIDTMLPAGSSPQIASVLENMRALGREIDTSIAAIRANALPLLQESVSRQELLCALLASEVNRTEGEARAEIVREWQALESRLHTYAALLERCRKTNALLTLLCKSYAGAYGAVFSRSRMLSCEV